MYIALFMELIPSKNQTSRSKLEMSKHVSNSGVVVLIFFSLWNENPIYSMNYRQVSNIRRTKSQHLKDSRTVLRLSLPKQGVKSRMKM